MTWGIPRYPRYRSADASWFGELPDHWCVVPGHAAYRERKIKNTGLTESRVLTLSYGRVLVKPPEKLHGLVPESFETYQITDPGNIIIRPTDLQNDRTSLRVGLVQHRGIITSAYLCLEPKSAIAAGYLYLILHTYDEMKQIYALGSGLRQNLDFSDLKRVPIPIPPLREQDQIIRFVEFIDLRIHRLIRAKRRQIELLNEQKQAIIHQAVTRGLDPDVPLKPSGVEWLGDVPAHWEVLRAKYVFREVDLRSTTGEETHLSMSQKMGLVRSSTIAERRLISQSYVGGKLCQRNDLVLNRLKAHLGVFAVAPNDGLISPDYSVFRLHRPGSPSFFEAVLRTLACRTELRRRVKGIVEGLWRLYTGDFYDVRIPVPPVSEQNKIMEFLAAELGKLDDFINRTQREINLIREYRTRLIADVVTGKLDVRGVELPELDEAVDGNDKWDEEQSDEPSTIPDEDTMEDEAGRS